MAYHSNKSGGVWVMPARGGVARQVAVEGSRPAWSPDGLRIAYQSDEHVDVTPSAYGASAGSTIWVVNADGTGARALTSNTHPLGGHASPAWSPDGRFIGFTVFDGGRENGAWIVDTNTGLVTPAGIGRSRSTRWCSRRTAARFYMAGGEALIYRLPFDPLNGVRRGPPSPSRCRACRGYVGYRSPPTASASASPASPSTARSGRSRFAPTARRGARPPRSPGHEPPDLDGRDLAGWIAHRLHVVAQGRSAECVGDGCRRQPQGAGDVQRCGGRQAQLVPRRRTPRLLLESWQEQRLVVTRRVNAARDAAARRRGADAPAVCHRPSGGDGAVAVPDSRRSLGRQRAGCQATALYTTSLSSFDPRPIGDFPDSVGYPVWSPDERLLAVEIKDGSSTQAGIVDLSTGTLTRLTRSAARRGCAAGRRMGGRSRWPLCATASGACGGSTCAPPSKARSWRRVPPNVYVRYPAWSSRSDVVVFERGELHGNIWMVPLS